MLPSPQRGQRLAVAILTATALAFVAWTPAEPRKAYDDVFGEVFVDFKQVAVVNDQMNEVAHIIRLIGRFRNHRVQAFIGAS